MRARRALVMAAAVLTGALLALPVLGGPAARAAVALDVTSSVTPNAVIIGDTATYTVTVRNTGSTAAADVQAVIAITPAGSVTIGTLPAGCTASGQVVTCTAAALGPGGTLTVQIPVTVSPSLSDGTNIRLEATARDAAGDTGRAQPLITQARTQTDVSITKTASPASVSPGGSITYTITVTNHGPSDAVNVTWHDETNGQLTSIDGYPCGNTGLTVSCSVGTLAPGETRTYTITLTVGPTVPDGTVIPNCAVVYTGTSPDTNLDNNQSCVNTPVTAAPGGTGPAAGPMLGTVKTAPLQVYENGTVTYTVTVTNPGPGDAAGVRVSDTLDSSLDLSTLELPDGCTLSDATVVCQAGTLTAGETRTFVVTAKVRSGVMAGTNVMNCASANSDSSLIRVAPLPSCAQTLVVTVPSVQPAPFVPLSDHADISVAKTAPARVGLDGTVTYLLTVTNQGPGEAANAVAHDPVDESLVSVASLPDDCSLTDGTVACDAGVLQAGESRTFVITVLVKQDVGNRTVIGNCADAYAATDDPDIGNNESCASTIAGLGDPPATSVVTTKDGPATVRAGGTLGYAVTVTNRGIADADGLIIRDPLDEPLLTPGALPAGCVAAAGTVTCTVGTLPAGESRTLRFTATAAAGTRPGTRIDNCAMADSSRTLLTDPPQSACTEADVSGQPQAAALPAVPVTG